MSRRQAVEIRTTEPRSLRATGPQSLGTTELQSFRGQTTAAVAEAMALKRLRRDKMAPKESQNLGQRIPFLLEFIAIYSDRVPNRKRGQPGMLNRFPYVLGGSYL